MSNVVHLQQVQITDPVFFKKEDIKIGSRLSHHGRRDGGTLWEVRSIRSFKNVKDAIGKKVQSVNKLYDEIELYAISNGFPKGRSRWMYLTFDYLSYSAIWRLENGPK